MNYDALASLVYYVFAAMAFICAIGVVASRNPVTSAMCMALSFLATAAILFGLDAHFLGVVQLIVYAGAILVLFLFVIMMLDVKSEERKFASLPRAVVGVVVASIFAGMVAHVAIDLPGATDGGCPFTALCCGECTPPAGENGFGGSLPKVDPSAAARALDPSISSQDAAQATSVPDAKLLGMTLFSQYNVAFALLAFALLGGTVGAIALGRRIRKD